MEILLKINKFIDIILLSIIMRSGGDFLKKIKKDTVKKIAKKVFSFKTLLLIAIIVIAFSLYQIWTRDKFMVEMTTLSSYSISDDADIELTVYDQNNINRGTQYKGDSTLSDKLLKILSNDKVKVKLSLYDSDGKKVRKVKETVKTTFRELNDIEMDIPEKFEPGKYTLKVKVSKGLAYDYIERELNFEQSSSDIINISMDKGIYKPGDEVKFRALVTSNIDNAPIQNDALISIYDGNENRVYYEEVKTSEFGIVSGVFNLGSEVNSGLYKLVVCVGNKEKVQQFKVDSYTEERFKIETTNAKEVFSTTDNIEFEIKASYFFGEPVVDASVEVVDLGSGKTEKFKTDSNGIVKVEVDDINNNNNNNNNNNDNYYNNSNNKSFISNDYLVKVTDVSNYYVEKTHNVVVSDMPYAIEIVPEYGDLVSGVKNRIYIYVKDLQNNPVENIECSFEVNNITREFTTDADGIGYVDLSSADIDKIGKSGTKKIYVTTLHEEFGIVRGICTCNVLKTVNVIKTDDVLYEQGEAVELTLGNYSENEEKLYVVKNGELVKSINISEDVTEIDLENTYGLIDLYVGGSSLENSTKLNKRTIFIKPKDGMKINLSTDSEVYKPSDNMTLSIDSSNKEDAAYLVSIIDTANLNMADNDLNIDKIKLALEGIKFTDGVDAATVYASIMANSNERELERLLMKQSSKALTVNFSRVYPDIDLEVFAITIAITIMVCLGVLALCAVIYNLSGREDNELFNFISKTLVVIAATIFVIWIILYTSFDFNVVLALVLAVIGSIFAYSYWLNKYENEISKVIYELILTMMFGYAIAGMIVLVVEFIGFPIFALAAIIIGIIIYKKRNSMFVKTLKEIVVIVIKTAIILFLTAFLSNLFIEMFDVSYYFESLVNMLAFCGLNIALYKYRAERKEFRKEKKISTDEKHKDIFYYIGIGFVVFCVLSTLGVTSVVRNFSSNIATSDSIYDATASSGSMINGRDDSLDVSGFTSKSDNSSASSSAGFDWSSVKESAVDSFIPSISLDSIQSSKGESAELEEMGSEDVVEDTTSEVTTEEATHIRNVFLESLAFMPEVIAEKGNTDVDIKLSDNITTWKIQVVGNTKNGDVAYTNKEFKVFKEFFVDFTIPNNLKVGDKISIPASVYNYTEGELAVNLNVKEDSWFKLTNGSTYNTVVAADGQELVYIDIEVLKQGDDNKLRVEAKANGLTDIIERVVPVDFKGIKVSKISANGNTKDDISGEVLFKDEYIEGSNSVTVNLYPNLMSFAIEGMDSILRMPSGCFEQVSSSLYPDIMVLEYLESLGSNDENDKLKVKAKDYINVGYQKLLTYEVPGEPGGFSLYGKPKAETVLTAYGLMELNDLSKVYDIDEKVLERMEEFLDKKQNADGSFDITGYSHVVDTRGKLANSAYILWAVSEYNNESDMLERGVKYIKNNIDSVTDNYVLALMINTLVNVDDSDADKYIDILLENLNKSDNGSGKYLVCDTVDYMGTRNNRMNVQTTALLSMALSKENKKDAINQELIDYIISQRSNTSWGTTQSTVLALRAINCYNANAKTSDQKIKVTVGNETQEVELKKSGVTFVRFDFENLDNVKSATFSIDGVKSNIYYEVIKNYYVDYDKFTGLNDLKVSREFSNRNLMVNDILKENILIENNVGNHIDNIMVEVEIPQGFILETDNLEKLVALGIIEKYESNYGKVYIYLRNLAAYKKKDFDVEFRAAYPVDIVGGAARVYDYYNPETVEYIMPERIVVSK